MNVMLTCAGRRNYLVKSFQDALRGRGQVFAADASADAPALSQADKSFVLPLLDHPAYLDTLLALCEEHRVSLLIPLNDLELLLLARHSARFVDVGTLPVISSPEVVRTCSDKWETAKFLKTAGLETPNTYLSLANAHEALARGDAGFPLVVKPRWGSASIGIEYAMDAEELDLNYTLAMKRLPRTSWELSAAVPAEYVLLQTYFDGLEYGLDIVNDLQGNYVCTFVKLKLGMRAGETDRAISVKSEWLEGIGASIGRRLGHIGVLDCDAIVVGNRCYVLDLNPRFGGGYPFSHVAGANLPAALIAWASRAQPDASWLRVEPGVAAAKCDGIVFLAKQTTVKPVDDEPSDSVQHDAVVRDGNHNGL